ncbi:Homeodomain protein [Pseudocohnilembus persalinus]|uniref:Homeodomain protein n=1 Tax=Pseudocohnilembus persalinus TaxID=266149 RepID=A0A0V0R718_PSEPJ|nr:Homeodomain protein [Pseudocohnilembus persalinus]|eukprot:KRX10274.1 Homeodomain protein [Pseudocohnilembus persalinus]
MEQGNSNSLWNYTLSPGWNEQEVQVLKQALQYFGIGKWKQIQEHQCLPDKTISQIYMQTQRLLGQQSLGDLFGLRLHLDKVWENNKKKVGVIRKFGCIINTGDNPNKNEKLERQRLYNQQFGLSKEEIKKLKIPYSYKNLNQVMSLEQIQRNEKKLTNLQIIEEYQNLKNEITQRIKIFKQIKIEQQQQV